MQKLADAFHGLLPFEQDEIANAYLGYLKNGNLPDTACQPKRILVIGCGIAGMVSATMLKKAGHNVSIVEANTRVGGRCKTFRNSAEKQYFEDGNLTGEAGAMRIPDMHKLVNYLIEYTAVKKQIFLNKTVSKEDATSEKIQDPEHDDCGNIKLPPATGKNFIYVNYRRVLRGSDKQEGTYECEGANINALLDAHLNDNENTQASTLLEAAIGALRKRVDKDPKTYWPMIIEKYGEYSMRQFLKESFPTLSENAIGFIGTLENLASRMSYSFIQSFIELAIIKPDTVFWLIKGGTDKLTHAYYHKEELAEITSLNQTVVDLYKDSDGKIRINTTVSKAIESSAAADLKTRDCLARKCWDEVIVTIPFPAFRMVHVWPRFSHEKRHAIRELHYDAATKVLLEFRERFWETENDIYGGGSITDLPNRYMYYPSERMGSSGGGLMLVSYSWADDARKWDSMSDYDRFCYALDNVAISHAIHAPNATWDERLKAQNKIRDLCVFNPELYKDDQENILGGATISWMSNPYAFGEAAIFYPGQLELFHESIIQSEWEDANGRCIAHFAGEHASLKHAWIEGAIESAMNAALIVNENELPKLSYPDTSNDAAQQADHTQGRN